MSNNAARVLKACLGKPLTYAMGFINISILSKTVNGVLHSEY